MKLNKYKYLKVSTKNILSGWDYAHPAAAHQRQPHHQRELGPGREGRHGDDAQQVNTLCNCLNVSIDSLFTSASKSFIETFGSGY